MLTNFESLYSDMRSDLSSASECVLKQDYNAAIKFYSQAIESLDILYSDSKKNDELFYSHFLCLKGLATICFDAAIENSSDKIVQEYLLKSTCFFYLNLLKENLEKFHKYILEDNKILENFNASYRCYLSALTTHKSKFELDIAVPLREISDILYRIFRPEFSQKHPSTQNLFLKKRKREEQSEISGEHGRDNNQKKSFIDLALKFSERYSNARNQAQVLEDFFKESHVYLNQNKTKGNSVKFLLIRLADSEEQFNLNNHQKQNLSDFIAQLIGESHRDMNSIELTTVLHRLAKLFRNKNLLEPPSFLETIRLLSEALESKKSEWQILNIANSLWGFGALASRPSTSCLLTHVSPTLISSLVKSLAAHTGKSAQNIANSLWALGWLANDPPCLRFLDTVGPDSISKLVDSLANIQEDKMPQTIANTLWALSKLAAKPTKVDLLSQLTPKIILTLVNSLVEVTKSSQEISTSLWALGVLASHPDTFHLLDSLTPTLISRLVDLLVGKCHKNTQHLANSLWALGKLAATPTKGYWLSRLSLDSVARLVNSLAIAMPSDDEDAQGVSNSLWALAKLVGDPVTMDLLEKVTSANILTLVTSLANQTTKDAQETANSLWALGTLASDPASVHLLSDLTPALISSLLNSLAEQSKRSDAQNISNSLSVLSKLGNDSATVHLLGDLTPALISNLVASLADKPKKDTQSLANTLASLARLIDNPATFGLLGDVPASRISQLVASLANQPNNNPQEIANSLWALGKLAAHPATTILVNNINPADIKNLVISLANQENIDKQSISSSLSALAKLAGHPKTVGLLSEVPSECVAKLVDFLCGPEGNLQDIDNIFHSMNDFAENNSTYRLITGITAKQIYVLGNKLISEGRKVALPTLIYILRLLYQFSTQGHPAMAEKELLSETVGKLIQAYFAKLNFGRGRKTGFQKKREYALLRDWQNILALMKYFSISSESLAQEMFVAFKEKLQLRLSVHQLEEMAKIRLSLKEVLSQDQIGQLDALLRSKIKHCPEEQQRLMAEKGVFQDFFGLRASGVSEKAEQREEREEETTGEPMDLSPQETPFSWTKLSRTAPAFSVNPRDMYQVSYDPFNEKDIKAFLEKIEKENPKDVFQYDSEFNKKRTKVKVRIAEFPSLPGQYCVIAAEDIEPSNHTIGCYAGQLDTVIRDEESLYLFEFLDKAGNIVAIRDAKQLRDFTGELNHSVTPNLIVRQRCVKGVYNAHFYPIEKIKKGEQLFFNYGSHYDVNFQLYYFHPSDSWRKREEVYAEQAQKNRYAQASYRFDAWTSHVLQLANTEWVIPTSFERIVEKDAKGLARLFEEDKNYPVDLVAYSYSGPQGEEKMSETEHQQHLTALMWACFLGDEACIDTLVAHGADVNRCMLVEGFMPLTLLLIGQNRDVKSVEKIGLKLLDKMRFPFIQDKYELSLLHYMLKQNAVGLIKEFLRIAVEEKYDVFEPMFMNRKESLPAHADVDECIRQGQWDILTLLLQYVVDSQPKIRTQWMENINNGLLFKEETFLKLSLEHLKTLKDVLTPYAELLKATEVLPRLEEALIRASQEKQEIVSDSRSGFFPPSQKTPKPGICGMDLNKEGDGDTSWVDFGPARP
jgi:hypothetical protein